MKKKLLVAFVALMVITMVALTASAATSSTSFNLGTDVIGGFRYGGYVTSTGGIAYVWGNNNSASVSDMDTWIFQSGFGNVPDSGFTFKPSMSGTGVFVYPQASSSCCVKAYMRIGYAVDSATAYIN